MSDLLSSGLKLEVLDSDTFGKDDPLGTLNVDLSDILTQDTISYEQPLPTKGTLCFTISFLELDGRLISQGTLTVSLLRGSGLAAADSNGKSDPYVKLSLGKSKAKSKTIPKTLDPEWNERFEFQGTRAHAPLPRRQHYCTTLHAACPSLSAPAHGCAPSPHPRASAVELAAAHRVPPLPC